MIKTFSKAALMAATGLAAIAMVPASASAATFAFDGGPNSDGSIGNVRTFTGTDGTKVEVSAYSLDVNVLAQAAVGWYSPGLGVLNGPLDNSHTVDNSGLVDILVFQFDKVVTVDKLGIASFGDTDLNYAIGSTVTPFSGTLSIPNQATFNSLFGATILSNGNGSSENRDINAGNLSGNLFYVAAAFSNSQGNDSFKVSGMTYGATPAVPEPASWAMLIGGMAVTGAALRRRSPVARVQFA